MSTTRIVISSGAVFSLPLRVKKKDSAGVYQNVAIDLSSTVTVSVRNHTTTDVVYIDAISVSSGASGSDWPNGLIVAAFTATDTDFTAETEDAEVLVKVVDPATGETVHYPTVLPESRQGNVTLRKGQE